MQASTSRCVVALLVIASLALLISSKATAQTQNGSIIQFDGSRLIVNEGGTSPLRLRLYKFPPGQWSSYYEIEIHEVGGTNNLYIENSREYVHFGRSTSALHPENSLAG